MPGFGRPDEGMMKGVRTPRQHVPNPLAYSPKVRPKGQVKKVINKKRQGIVTALGSVRG